MSNTTSERLNPRWQLVNLVPIWVTQTIMTCAMAIVSLRHVNVMQMAASIPPLSSHLQPFAIH